MLYLTADLVMPWSFGSDANTASTIPTLAKQQLTVKSLSLRWANL